MRGRLAVVCRHNQARSVMAAAALRRYYPDVEVISAGIEAVEGQRIPESILNLADAWGLDVLEVISHSLSAVKEQLVASDLVVVAEDEFISYLIELGVHPQKILSMQDKRFEHAVIPFDPVGQSGRILSAELAKAVMTSTQLVREYPGFGGEFLIEAVFTRDEADLQNKFGIVWEKFKMTNGVILLTDFRAPNFRAVSQVCGPVLELKVDRTCHEIDIYAGIEKWELQTVLSLPGPFALSGRYELDQVEKFVLGSQFTRLVRGLATRRPVTILTEPTGLGACAFLTASNANIGPIFG